MWAGLAAEITGAAFTLRGGPGPQNLLQGDFRSTQPARPPANGEGASEACGERCEGSLCLLVSCSPVPVNSAPEGLSPRHGCVCVCARARAFLPGVCVCVCASHRELTCDQRVRATLLASGVPGLAYPVSPAWGLGKVTGRLSSAMRDEVGWKV